MAAGGDKLWRREISLRQHRPTSSRPDDQGLGRAEVHALSANYDDLKLRNDRIQTCAARETTAVLSDTVLASVLCQLIGPPFRNVIFPKVYLCDVLYLARYNQLAFLTQN